MTCATPVAALLLALVAQAPESAETAWTPIPRAVLFGSVDKLSVALDPSGRRVGWLGGPPGGRVLWVADVEAPAAAAPLDLPGVVAWRWAPDGSVLAILAGDQGDRLVSLELPDGVPADRTPLDGAALRFVGTSPHRPHHVVVSARTTADDSSGVYRVQVQGTSAAERLSGLDGHDRFWVDGQLALRLAHRPLPSGAVLSRRVDDEWVEHARYTWEEARLLGVVSLSTDGSRAYIVDNKKLDKAALKAVDVLSGEEQVLVRDPLADLLWAGATVDSSDGAVQAVVSYFARMRRHVLEPSLAGDFEALRSVHPGDLSFVGRSADDTRWLVRFMDGGPLDYYLYDRTTRRARALFSDLPALDGVPLATRHALAVPARDGLLLPAHLYLPAGSDTDGDGRPTEPLPTVLYVHGGPWVGFEWNVWFSNRCFQLLADRGYAVIRTEFRGASGLGRSFMDAGDEQWGAAMHHDLLDMTRWAVEHGVADEQRLAIWGWSYGGYASMSALAFSPDVFAAGISMYGLSDLVRFAEALLDAGRGEDSWFRRVGDVRGRGGREMLRERSPLFSADRMTSPLLVTHGSRDTRSPQRQSDLIVESLTTRDHPVTYLVYPDEPHDYRRAESWTSFWAVGERFLAEHLGGRFEPFGGELVQAQVEVVTGAEHVPGLAGQLPSPSARADDATGSPPR